jgi:hypothetical protein
MKVSELIEKLKAMPQDLEVYSYCDHGQTPEKSSSPEIAYTNSSEYFLEDWSDCKVWAKSQGYKGKFVMV